MSDLLLATFWQEWARPGDMWNTQHHNGNGFDSCMVQVGEVILLLANVDGGWQCNASCTGLGGLGGTGADDAGGGP
eukprot:518931-Amphidinium_carterae.2